jgi:hypothetical protein
MSWETLKRPLICPNCGREGMFVYEQETGAYTPGMVFKSLTAGFSFKDTGFANTSTITCSKCEEIVFGPNRGWPSAADKKAS